MAGPLGSPEYSITWATVVSSQWGLVLRNRGGVGISPGLFSIGGNQWKGSCDDEPTFIHFVVDGRSLQGTKRIGTSENGCDRCSSSFAWRHPSSGRVVMARCNTEFFVKF
jgi:hypothetical protein